MLTRGDYVDGIATKKFRTFFSEFHAYSLTGDGVSHKDGPAVGYVRHRSAIGDTLNQDFFAIEHRNSLRHLRFAFPDYWVCVKRKEAHFFKRGNQLSEFHMPKRVLILGCDSVAQYLLPLLLDHFDLDLNTVTVLESRDNRKRIKDSIARGVQYSQLEVTLKNLRDVFNRHLLA